MTDPIDTPKVGGQTEGLVERTMCGETVNGFAVAAYRETHPEHGSAHGHIYSEHWSTPNTRDPRVTVDRLFTEAQLLEALSSQPIPTEATELLREARNAFNSKLFDDERKALVSRIDALLAGQPIPSGSQDSEARCGDMGYPLCDACNQPIGDLTQHPGCGGPLPTTPTSSDAEGGQDA
jgi:hypothetical protein